MPLPPAAPLEHYVVVAGAPHVVTGLTELGTRTHPVGDAGGVGRDLVAGSVLVVVDAALEPDALVAVLGLAQEARVPVVLEPADPAAARTVVLGPHPVHTVVADPDVLAALTGLATTTDDEVDEAVQAVLARDVEVVWLRGGPSGALLGLAGRRGTSPLPADDPGTAAYCHALLAGADPLAVLGAGTG